MKIAILGAGPAALIAGYACERNGHDPVFFARGEPSVIQPGMYLMRPLPGLASPEPDALISYERRGTAVTYAAKVYGSPRAAVSWEHVEWGADRPLWWLSSVYDQLWWLYKERITSVEINSKFAEEAAQAFNFVINTLPAPTICTAPGVCYFNDRKIKLVRAPVADNLEDASKIGDPDKNIMLYNGLWEFDWFRYTRIDGQDTWEFPHDAEPSLHDINNAHIFPGVKPIGNTCDCHPRIARVGRWAQWERGVLNHHTFERTQGILASAGLGKEIS